MPPPNLGASLQSAGSSSIGSQLHTLSQKITSRLNFLTHFDQRERMMQVHTALPTLALVPERMVMREAVGQPFELVVDCVSTSAYAELKTLIGEQISLHLLQRDRRHQPWHGYVFEAAQLGSDGGVARYRLVMRPWLSFLSLRRDSFIFQRKTALQVIEEVFADYPQARWRVEVSDTLATRELCTQFDETDLAFVERLLAEEGLSYHFEHDGPAAKLSEAKQALHTLVITDRNSQRPTLGAVKFSGLDDSIREFSPRRQITANAATRASWSYRELGSAVGQASSALSLGELPTLELYMSHSPARFESSSQAQRSADLAVAALELQAKQFLGTSQARHLQAGRQFELQGHALWGAVGLGGLDGSRSDAEFTLLAVEHHATNNLGSEAAQILGNTDLERGLYRNQFVAVAGAAAVVPAFVPKPTVYGAHTALVVGLPGEAVLSDRDHRVKIQFPWQRGVAPVAGGLSHDASSPDTQGNAPGHDGSGTWVRLASPAAGANWGAVLTPRIGAEVLVSFVDGDVDQPVVAGVLYNRQDALPFAAGVDSGVNHPGVISGLHAHTLDGSGFNQWVVDDATGQLRMRLLCSYSLAEVGLGYLIGQQAHSAQRGAWRGSGFEAQTQAWATLRAGRGLMISTQARPGSGHAVASTQMDNAEALAQFKAARDLAQRISQAAESAQAAPLACTQGALNDLVKASDAKADGSLAKAVGATLAGQATQTSNDGSRTLNSPVHAPGQPLVWLDSAAAQAWLTPSHITSLAGQNLSLLAQSDVHEAAAHTHTTIAGQAASFYTHSGGIQAKAANGPVSLRAHTDELQLLADKDITVISVNGEIKVSASSKIELVAGDSGITLDGANITFTTPGSFTAKGSLQEFLGGGSGKVQGPSLPQGSVNALPSDKPEPLTPLKSI